MRLSHQRADLVVLLQWAVRELAARVSDAALAYAWCKVCFTAWDATLEAAGEKILAYSRWPASLTRLLHALYPAYFVYSSMKRLSGPEGPAARADVGRWASVLTVACVAAGAQAMRAGEAQRRAKG